MKNLRVELDELARSFAASVLETIRSASVDELVTETDTRRAGAVPTGAANGVPATATGRQKREVGGRLRRRSAEQIASVLDQVVALLKRHSEGMRAEQIRSTLGLLPKEMPRILKAGLSRKVLKCKGIKRATTYFAR